MDPKGLAVETWTWWSIGMVIIAGRMISRVLQRGIKGLQTEDYLMLLVTCTYTAEVVCLNITYPLYSNLVLPGEDLSQDSPSKHKSRILGSKFGVIDEQMILATVWITKACMLLLYHRLTYMFDLHIYVKLIAAYCIVAYLTMQILFLGVWCRPFSQYWAVPVVNIQCSTYEHHLITSTVLNISSDLMILALPLPLLFRSSMPLMQKLGLYCLFGLGIFTVIAACINKAAYFLNPYSSNWPFQVIRESSAAVYVANLPFWWTLLKRVWKTSPCSTSAAITAPTVAGLNEVQLSMPTHQGIESNGSESCSDNTRQNFEKNLV